MFDQTTGNLIYRKDVKRGFTQTFGYDDLNRLTTITPTYTTAVAGFPSAVTIFYAINGNIQSKSDVSGENYVYEKGRPNSVEFVLNSAVINPKNQVINYNAFDEPNNPFGGKPQPGQYSGKQYTNLTIENITDAAIRDGCIKKPNLFNKLGYGKRGYYEVYLVIDNVDGVQDYHWYRQDKGGYWSQKHGNGFVTNYDGSNHLIVNPAKANHFYGSYYNKNGNFSGNLFYNNGGIFLWVKRK